MLQGCCKGSQAKKCWRVERSRVKVFKNGCVCPALTILLDVAWVLMSSLLPRILPLHDEDEVYHMHWVVVFGLTVNITMILACFMALAWLKKGPLSRQRNQHHCSTNKLVQEAENISLAQKPQPTMEVPMTQNSKPAAATGVIQPIYASKDLDTQNMLLASANLSLFFQGSSSGNIKPLPSSELLLI